MSEPAFDVCEVVEEPGVASSSLVVLVADGWEVACATPVSGNLWQSSRGGSNWDVTLVRYVLRRPRKSG